MSSFLHNCLQRVRYSAQALNLGSAISQRYVQSAPSPQNALDIFKGEWWSRLPAPFAALHAGALTMFEDVRISWALSQFGELKNQSVLELGPLEGGHSYMFERAGAASVLAIEANPRAYLKCLVVKEILNLRHTHFLCGDFLEYWRNDPPRCDAACASGVLYHTLEPVELIAPLSKVTDRLFLWTHYYDPQLLRPKQLKRFTAQYEREYEGFSSRLFRYNYWGSLGARRFCGGSRAYAHWARREEILACLEHFGFNTVHTAFETPDHADGPALALVALRR